MITVEVDKIAPSEHGLCLGLIVRYGVSGPVRFAQAYLGSELLTADVRADLMRLFNQMLDKEPEDETLF